MPHGFPEVTLQTTRHEVIFDVYQEMTSACEVIWHDRAVTSMGSMVQNGRKYIAYLYNLVQQLLTYVSGDVKCY